MTAERDTVSVGSCPACRGPAQFIVGERDPDALPLPGMDARKVEVRHVVLPNIDEDLGGGWSLKIIEYGRPGMRLGNWHATASRPRRESGGLDFEYGFGGNPTAAYLALRTAIEARS